MYPAQALADGLYPAGDLPDAITLLGVGSLVKSGTNYGNATNGVILESGVWARYLSGVRTTKACLIDDDGNLTPGDDLVEDQFPNTLLMATEFIIPPGYTTLIDIENALTGYGRVPANIILTRVSLCVWENVVSIPFYWAQTDDYIANYDVTFSVYYNYPSGIMWEFFLTSSVLIGSTFSTGNYDIFTETAVNNTPVGLYSSNVNTPTIEIA
jgi:hypothetical protein